MVRGGFAFGHVREISASVFHSLGRILSLAVPLLIYILGFRHLTGAFMLHDEHRINWLTFGESLRRSSAERK